MATGGTIAAICSAPGNAPRAMIRVSGEHAGACASQLCGIETRARCVSRVRVNMQGATLPAIAIWFPKGESYTGQPTLEMCFAGNQVLARRVLDRCIAIEGVRLAEPGEFSAWAYLAGRLTLQHAEGIALRIAAQHQDELDAASTLLDGSHGRMCSAWTDQLAGLLALVESGVDFTDQEDVVPITPTDLNEALLGLIGEIEGHTQSARGQLVHTQHPVVVLVGAPNAGKSTIMNALLGCQRVAVSESAGTTRDVIREELDLSRDLPGAGRVMLTDLAGLGDRAVDAIDAQAQRAARECIEKADVIVWCDPTGRFDDPSIPVKTQTPTLRVRTKSDLPSLHRREGIAVCALDGTMMGTLRHAIADAAATRSGSGVGAFVPRHGRAMSIAIEGIRVALTELDPDSSCIEMPELVASGLREALDALGELSGEVTPDDVLGRVFSSFCVGK